MELFYCGSAERERVEEAISRAFVPLQRGRVVPPVIAEKKNAPETPREITERMDVTQGRLSMGRRACDDAGKFDFRRVQQFQALFERA